MMSARAQAIALAVLAVELVAASAIADDELIVVPSLDELEAVEQLDAPDVEDENTDTLLVRSASNVATTLAEAPGILTVLTSADIRAMGARTLYDALRYAPELDVTRDSFGVYHVAVRGRRVDTEVLVLLDGHRLNDFYDGRILYELPISVVERIEILRGPGSALYGTNAFAGVISVYTRRRSGRHISLQLSSSGGDRERIGPRSFWLAGHGGLDVGRRFRAHGSVEVGREIGPRLLVPEDSLTRNRMDPDTGDSQSRSCDNQPVASCPASAFTAMPRTLVRASGGLDSRKQLLTAGDRLSLQTHALYVDRGPFIGEFDTLTPDTRLETARLLANANYELPLSTDALSLRIGTWLDLAAVDRDIQVAPDGFKEQVDGMAELFPEGQLKAVDYTEAVLRQDARLRWSHGGLNTLIVGAEVEHTRMPEFSFETNYDDAGRRFAEMQNPFPGLIAQDGETRTLLGVYVEDLVSVPFGLTLVAGGRFDLYSDFGSAISPRAGAVLSRGDVSLKLFFGQAFRAPTFQELYDQTGRIDLGQFVGNPNLAASTVRTVEGAATYAVPLDDHMLEVTVTAARSSIRDSVDTAPLTGLTNTFLNTSQVDSTSASAEVRADLWQGRVSMFSNASFQSATADYEYVDPSQGLDFRTVSELLNVPRYRLNAGLRARVTARYSGGAFAEIGGRRKNNERTPLEGQHFFDFPPYALVQIFGQAERVWRDLFVRVALHNVTNARVHDEPFRANRMPQGIPRDRLRASVTVGMDL